MIGFGLRFPGKNTQVSYCASGHRTTLCLVTGDVTLDHVDRGQLPASSMANVPFLLLQLINIYLGVGGRDFQTIQISYFSLNFLLISPLILTSISGSYLQPFFLWCPHGDFLFSFFFLYMSCNFSVKKSCLFYPISLLTQ